MTAPRSIPLGLAAAALLAGCGGSDGSMQTLSGDTVMEGLGLELIVGDVEVGGDETRVPLTMRNASAHKLVLDPFSSTLVVDGESHVVEESEFPTLIPDVGSGGGEANGVLVFPAVAADAASYELQVKGTSENTTLGDDGNIEWTVVLAPADESESS